MIFWNLNSRVDGGASQSCKRKGNLDKRYFLVVATNAIANTALIVPASKGIRHTPSNPKAGTKTASPASGKISVPIIDTINDLPACPKAVKKPDKQPSIQFTR